MDSGKLTFKTKREGTGETLAWGLEFGAVAVAIAIIVAIPIVLDLDAVILNPNEAYYPPKFKVLMGFSAVLLVAVLGAAVLRGKIYRVPVLAPALVFLGVSTLSTLLSDDPLYTLSGDRKEGLLTLGAGVLLFYALARGLNSPLRARVFLAAGVATAVLIALFGISQKYGVDMISGWGNHWYRNLGRPFSTLGNPLGLASYLMLMMGVATALCFKAGSSSVRYRLPWLLALAVIGMCWIYTDTRGAMLGVMVALPVVLWLARRKMGTARPLLMPLITLIAAMAVAVAASAAFGNLSLSSGTLAVFVIYLAFVGVVLWLSRLGARAMRLLLAGLAVLIVAGIAALAVLAVSGNLSPPERETNAGNGDLSTQVRLYIWRDTVSMILDRPLLGYGPDNFAGPFSSYIGEDLIAATTTEQGVAQKIDRAHSDILQIAQTTGLLGLAAYVWIFVSYFRNVYRRGGWPLISLSGGVLAYIVEIQTAFPNIATSIVLWGILGASVAIMRLQDQEESESEPEIAYTSTALTTTRSRIRLAEPLVVVTVVGLLTAVAIPSFLEQRGKSAELEKATLMINVAKTVSTYNEIKAESGVYPPGKVYTRPSPILGPNGGIRFRPSINVTLTTDVTPTGEEFTVEGERVTLGGTFRYSYNSGTDTYTGPDEAAE